MCEERDAAAVAASSCCILKIQITRGRHWDWGLSEHDDDVAALVALLVVVVVVVEWRAINKHTEAEAAWKWLKELKEHVWSSVSGSGSCGRRCRVALSSSPKVDGLMVNGAVPKPNTLTSSAKRYGIETKRNEPRLPLRGNSGNLCKEKSHSPSRRSTGLQEGYTRAVIIVVTHVHVCRGSCETKRNETYVKATHSGQIG